MADWELSGPRWQHCAVALSDTELAVMGGTVEVAGNFTKYSDVTKYNIYTGESTQLPDLPEANDAMACCLYKGKLTISGGQPAWNENSDYKLNRLRGRQVWQLDGDTWVQLPPLPYEIQGRYQSAGGRRYSHSMAEMEGDLYIFGGQYDNQKVLRLTSSGWEQMEPKLQERFYAGGVVIVEN